MTAARLLPCPEALMHIKVEDCLLLESSTFNFIYEEVLGRRLSGSACGGVRRP